MAANALADPLLAADAVGELFLYFTDLIVRRRHDPGDDVVSELVQASDAAGVPALQILGFAFTMITGGNDTTTGLLSVGLELLADEPEQRARLRAEPTAIPGAVEELRRLTSPVQGLARTSTGDVELGGRTIPAGRLDVDRYTCPEYCVDGPAGRFAPGHFVRWYESLPFRPDGR